MTIAQRLALAALAFAATTAHAFEVRLEVSPLVAIPIGPFLDAQATPMSQLDLESVGIAVPEAEATVLSDISNGVGGGVSISLLLDNWEIRYELRALPYDHTELTHVGITLGDLSIYLPADEIVGQEITADLSNLDSALFHTLGFGYRFEPFPEWAVSPYVPLLFGVGLAMPRNGADPVIGFDVQLGLGAHWRPVPVFDIGLAVRYELSVYKNPDTSLGALSKGASASVTTNSSAFDAALEILQAVSIGLTASVGF